MTKDERQSGPCPNDWPLFHRTSLPHNTRMTRTKYTPELPIDDVLDDLCAAVAKTGQAVLMAPPGAGKTTRVPLALLPQIEGKIIMLEPRRLATRSAAERMAQTLGEKLGQRVGYRMRGAQETSRDTRIEVVTEGILTRMLQNDPELSGIGAVIFDEFHERSLNADLGLALVQEVRGALRDDLALVVMSATLDAAPVAQLLGDAPIVTSQGRAFPVETHWLDKPLPKTKRLEEAVADLVVHATKNEDGSALVFLPGEGEIRRAHALLRDRLPADCAIRPLYGAMKFSDQRAAIAPCETGRKIVLATSIAETSLTIEDVRIVVDAGRARRARFDPASGMSRLITERVSKAEAEQRRGRAGRVAQGVCYRLWTKGEEGAMRAFPPAEIEITDLTGLALELAAWGGSEANLSFLTPPPLGPMAEARALLRDLGALDEAGRITDHGRKLARQPVHPRLAHMLQIGGKSAAELAALLNERDPMRGVGADLLIRLNALKYGDTRADRNALDRLKKEAKRLAKDLGKASAMSAGEMAAAAYPDRIGKRRKGDRARYVLSGGKGVELADSDSLATAPYLVVTDTDGAARDAKIRQAVAISEAEIKAQFSHQITQVSECEWDKRARRINPRKRLMLGAICLEDHPWKDPSPQALAEAVFEGIRDLGLPWTPAAKRFQARVALMGEGFPDMSEDALLAGLETWLAGYVDGIRTHTQIKSIDITDALRAQLDWGQMQDLDRLVPAHFESPLGRKIAIDYSGEVPEITARIQEMFGTKTHPTVGASRAPLRITLTSPAHRPVQTTMDLPNFWKTSYSDVRKDMRGRYPKHPWPEDPTHADPTLRAKRR